MKITHFLFAMVGFALWAGGPIYADPSSAANEQPASVNAANTASGDPTNVGQPLSGLPARVSRKAFIAKEKANRHALSIEAQSALSINERLPKNVRVRGPSPAILGGPSNKIKSMASVNGTGMGQKW